MKRREDWPERLNEYLDSTRALTAEWGVFDCSLMVANAMRAMTDVDCAEDFRGRYSDADGAFALLAQYGGTLETLLEAMARRHGWTEVQPSYAQRGDPCILKPEVILGEERFGGVMGMHVGHMVAFVNRRLLATAPMHVMRAWHFE